MGAPATLVVIDNGAYSVKLGLKTDDAPRELLNAVTKARHVKTQVFVGDQLEQCSDLSGIFYMLPFQKGFLTNWEVEKQVWDYMFESSAIDPSECDLTLTESYFNFPLLKQQLYEILFEEYGFQSVVSRPPSNYVFEEHHAKQQCLSAVVVDCGYSNTHIIPYANGRAVTDAVVRIDVGGKLLTNYLKETLSYRQMMLMDETHVVNQMKEDACFVALDFRGELQPSLRRDYILPDFSTLRRGQLLGDNEKTTAQVVRLETERITVPEILFEPAIVGLNQMGVSESLLNVISKFPEAIQPHMTANILLTGGSCNFANFSERLSADVTSRSRFPVCVFSNSDPHMAAWQAAKHSSRSQAVDRRKYTELGAAAFDEPVWSLFGM